MRSLLILLAVCGSAQAADKAWIVNDAKQTAMIAVCDAAIKQAGYSQLSRNAFALCDELAAAPVVTSQQVIPTKPDVPKDSQP